MTSARNRSARIYANTIASAAPSIFPEEFCPVAAERRMHRLPVVVTGPGGVTEVVKHEETGIVVPPRDAVALTDTLARLAADPELSDKMGELGRQRMMASFTVMAYRRNLAQVIDSSIDVA